MQQTLDGFQESTCSPSRTHAQPTASPAVARSKAFTTSLSALERSPLLQRFARSLFCERTHPQGQMPLGPGSDSPLSSTALDTIRSLFVSGRVALAATTNARGCSCSERGVMRTLKASEGKHGGPNGTDGGMSLTAEANSLLPTLIKQDGENNGGPSQHERNTPPLNSMASRGLLPTLIQGDEKGGRTSKGKARPDEMGLGAMGRKGKIGQAGLTGPLAPAWCLTFMSFPVHWFDPET